MKPHKTPKQNMSQYNDRVRLQKFEDMLKIVNGYKNL